MAKLDYILESIRDEYMINLLEEGEVSELETLKTKKFLNENLNRIRGMLVEEGAMDAIKDHLANNWGKYLAGAGGLAAGAAGADALANMGEGAIQAGAGDPGFMGNLATGAGMAADQAGEALQQVGDKLVDAAGNIYDQAGNIIGNMAQGAQNAVGEGLSAVGGGDPRLGGQPNFAPEDLAKQAGAVLGGGA